VRIVRWDAQSAEGWGALAEGADAIVNLAGASILALWTPARKRLIRESREEAGRAVVQAVASARVKPRVVIQTSGIGYYGPRGDEEISEEEPPGTAFQSQTAVAWEASTAPVESMGVRRAVLRNGLVLSPAGGSFPLVLLPFRLFLGGPLGSGRQWFPWIHIADEVRAIRFTIEHEESRGPVNLVAPHLLRYADFGRIVGRVMRRPSLVRVPAFAIRLVLGEMSTVVLDGQRAVPRRLLEMGFTFRFPDAEAALRDLLRRP
jgi:uncharacterized protein (TIGR01777 family)